VKLGLIFTAMVAAVLLPASAFAYVRTTTSSGTPIAWTSSCLQFHVDTRPNPQMSTDRTKAALDQAIAAWNTRDASCARMQASRGDDVANADVGYDGRSVVIWRLPGFCDGGRHAQDEACLAPNATATTTVFFRDDPGAADDGEIFEADMELDAVHFVFDDQGAPDKVDLPAVFAHETGHALGLDHTCYTSSADLPLLDDTGKSQPFCFPVSALPAPVVAATMFPFTTPGDTSKRGPTQDETEAVCTVYSQTTGNCHSGESRAGGCSIARASSRASRWGAIALLTLGGVLLVIRSWRRRP
jgi:hypothetical protein